MAYEQWAPIPSDDQSLQTKDTWSVYGFLPLFQILRTRTFNEIKTKRPQRNHLNNQMKGRKKEGAAVGMKTRGNLNLNLRKEKLIWITFNVYFSTCTACTATTSHNYGVRGERVCFFFISPAFLFIYFILLLLHSAWTRKSRYNYRFFHTLYSFLLLLLRLFFSQILWKTRY